MDATSSNDQIDYSSENCSICLCQINRKCFADRCLHEFCFDCLLTWSKIKAECPLCKQPFDSIIHNVESMDKYQEYQVDNYQEQEHQVESYHQHVASFNNRIDVILLYRLQELRIRLERVAMLDTIPSSRLPCILHVPNFEGSNSLNEATMNVMQASDSGLHPQPIHHGEGSNSLNVATVNVMQASDSGLHRQPIHQSDDGGNSCGKILFFALMAVVKITIMILFIYLLISAYTAVFPS